MMIWKSIRNVVFAAILAASCNPPQRPEGGAALQIAPDIHNLFRNATLYVSPEWKDELHLAADAVPEHADAILGLSKYPIALWIERAVLARTEVAKWIDDAGTAMVVVVIHDLPNRDCGRAASGELTLADEARYRVEVIDSVAASIATRDSHRVALVIEPNSLVSLATSTSDECAASDAVYRRSIAYAISRLSTSGVAIYLDAGNAETLATAGSRQKLAMIFKDVLDRAGGDSKIRGFATNVGSYSALESELRYIHSLNADLAKVGILDKFFVIDTSRNGRGDAFRKNARSWCNVMGAGLGERPRAAPARGIDAYFWIKVPGESDGTSKSYATQFDTTCASEDAMPHAPEAGEVFPAYLSELLRLANPPLR